MGGALIPKRAGDALYTEDTCLAPRRNNSEDGQTPESFRMHVIRSSRMTIVNGNTGVNSKTGVSNWVSSDPVRGGTFSSCLFTAFAAPIGLGVPSGDAGC